MESTRDAIIKNRGIFEAINELWRIVKPDQYTMFPVCDIRAKHTIVAIVQPKLYQLCAGNINFPLLNIHEIRAALDTINSEFDEKNVRVFKHVLEQNIELYKELYPYIKGIDFEALAIEEERVLKARLLKGSTTPDQAKTIGNKLYEIDTKIGFNWFESIAMAAKVFLDLINEHLQEEEVQQEQLRVNIYKLKFDALNHCLDFFRQISDKGHIKNSLEEIGEFIYQNIEFERASPQKEDIVKELSRIQNEPPKKNRVILKSS